MEPTFVDRHAFTVMGVQERFTPETEDFEGIWKRYMAYHDQVGPLSTDGAHYGVCFASDEEGAMDYVAGMAVPAGTPCIEGLVVRDVSAARDAVFECTVGTIRDAYEFIHHTWIGASPYVLDDPTPGFEQYPPGTESGESPVFIHAPVRGKKAP